MTATIEEMRRALRRLSQMVEEIAERSDYDRAAERNAGVDNQRFRYGDPAHKMKAEAIFDELDVSHNRRSWFYNKTLEGVPLGQLRELIRSEDAKYRARWGSRGRRA